HSFLIPMLLVSYILIKNVYEIFNKKPERTHSPLFLIFIVFIMFYLMILMSRTIWPLIDQLSAHLILTVDRIVTDMCHIHIRYIGRKIVIRCQLQRNVIQRIEHLHSRLGSFDRAEVVIRVDESRMYTVVFSQIVNRIICVDRVFTHTEQLL